MKFFIFPIILLVLLSISCSKDNLSSDNFEYKTEETKSLQLSTQTQLSVANTNGIISVTASDTASRVNCFVTRKVRSRISENDAKSSVSKINVLLTKNTNEVNIKVSHPFDDDREYEISLHIVLPDNFNFNLNLGNGDITAESNTKLFFANLGNGSISSNLTFSDTCMSAVSVGNGVISFKIPQSTNTRLTAAVGNGNISATGLTFQNMQIYDRQFSGVLGNGAGIITLSLGNGNIEIKK